MEYASITLMEQKETEANNWVNGYTVTGAAIATVAIIPGSSSIALTTMEAFMFSKIGKIFMGDDYKISDGARDVAFASAAGIVAKIAAIEALNFVPVFGWPAKSLLAAGIVKGMGEAMIGYYKEKYINLIEKHAKIAQHYENITRTKEAAA